MFLSSISKTCKQLGFFGASEDFSSACKFILDVASHTNTMMMAGKMDNCALDLPNQGQLLRHGRVGDKTVRAKGATGRKISIGSQKTPTCHLFLFQQAVVLCREKAEDQFSYIEHISVNKMRVRDTVAGHDNVFEIHKLEEANISSADSSVQSESRHKCEEVVIMRLECKSEEEKNEWVKALNKEVKQLRTMAKNLSSHCLFG